MRTRFMISMLALSTALCSGLLVSADGITKRINFKRGKHSATVSGSVVRGDRDTYIVRAKAGQLMSVTINSRENNAVFQVKGPDGEYLQDTGEGDVATDVTNVLPQDGDYKIVVGGTRGNATYRVTVSIK